MPWGRSRDEYVKLTGLLLCCGKVRLHRHICAIGGVFARGKPSGKQKELWNGHALSAEAALPPAPRQLANPASFLDLEGQPGQKVFFTKRDASCYFDHLAAPSSMHK